MDVLLEFFESSQWPLLSAFLLGLMTAISPCPLATNITAIGFISKDIQSRSKVFYNGLIYTLGRAITYTSIGLLFYFGIGQFKFSAFIQQWGERALGPLLIIIGLFMFGVIKVSIPGLNLASEKLQKRATRGYFGVLMLGIIFALAFCPYSGVIYFGMLIPMTIGSASGLYLPLIFTVATGIPVIIISWLLAFSLGSVGKFYDRIKIFELWFRRIVAVLFILIGIYFIYILFL